MSARDSRGIPRDAYRALLVSTHPFTASLRRDEAVLRFPYDERLRGLLRAIPGRRWDPVDRAWCVPLGPDQAEALARMLDALPHEPEVEEELAGAIRRRRARRRRDECVVELARPDSDWWLSFATDAAPGPVGALRGHPGFREIDEIGRALVPLDERSVQLVESLRRADSGLRLSVAAERAIHERGGSAPSDPGEGEPPWRQRHEVEFRRDRRGEHWILIEARGAALARVLAARMGLRPREGPAGSVGLAAREEDAPALLDLLDHLEDMQIDPTGPLVAASRHDLAGKRRRAGVGRGAGVPAARQRGAPARGCPDPCSRQLGGSEPAADAGVLAADRRAAGLLGQPGGAPLRRGARAGACCAAGGTRALGGG